MIGRRGAMRLAAGMAVPGLAAPAVGQPRRVVRLAVLSSFSG